MAKRHATDKRPTIAQIAAAAGVSVPTVSKVLNGRVDVAPTTREHIEHIIAEYGFVRNRAARALRKGKTGLVDVVVPRLDDEYFLPIFQSAEHVLKEAGVRMVLTSTHYETQEELQWMEAVTDRSTDGILLVLPSDEAIQRLSQHKVPFVVIHNQGGLPASIPSVTTTSWEGGFNATNYLISLGHRRIAYIGRNVASMDGIERFAGYRTALEIAALPLDVDLQREGSFSEEDGYTATMDLMALEEPPTAIFAGNDRQAVGVYRALHVLGLAIPGDVSVVGFDDLPFAALMYPTLTTVRVSRFDLGRIATTMLLRLIADEPVDPSLVVLPTQFVERESCAVPRSRS